MKGGAFASHIIPWAKNEEEILNPENQICLSALYDQAYDKGFIVINERFELLIPSDLKKKNKHEYYAKYFYHLENEKTIHQKNIFQTKNFFNFI